MLCHDSLMGYYSTLHTLHTYWGYNWDTIESMLPYEKEIVVNLIIRKIKEDESKQTKAEPALQHPQRWDKDHGVHA
jgi:hypothetical protein